MNILDKIVLEKINHTKYLSPSEFVNMSNKLTKTRKLNESYGLNNNDISNYDIISLKNIKFQKKKKQ